MRVGNTILHTKPVKAGYVLWQDDVTEICDMITWLQETQRQLDRQNALLQAELKLKEQQAQTEEKNRLYDRIAQEVAPQIQKMEALLAQAADPLQVRGSMAKICVVGSYVKRRANLLLLSEENRRIHARELEYCIRESLDNLQLASVSTMLESRCEDDLLLEHVIAAYDFYESLVEGLLDQITAMMVRLSCQNGTTKMNLQIGCMDEIARYALENLRLRFGSFTCTLQEADAIIHLEIFEGGVHG